MSPDRSNDDKKQDGKAVARISLVKRSIGVQSQERVAEMTREGVCETVRNDSSSSLLERKQMASHQALERVRRMQAASQQGGVIPQQKSEPDMPPSPATMIQRTGQAMQEALEKSREAREEAFRFLNRVISKLEDRVALQERLKEMLNKPENIEAIVTLVMEVDAFSDLLRRLEDTMHDLETDRNGAAACTPGNTERMRRELAEAEDAIRGIPSDPPISMGKEADMVREGMKPDEELVDEFFRMQSVSPGKISPERINGFFEKLDDYLGYLIDLTKRNVSLDAGFTLRVVMTFRQDLIKISQISRMATAHGSNPPQETRDEWNKGVGRVAGVVGRMTTKVDNLYRPAYRDFVRQLDYDSLEEELGRLNGELRRVEGRLEARKSDDEPTAWEKIRDGIKRVLPGGQQPSGYLSGKQLEVRRNQIRRRIKGMKEVIRLQLDLGGL